MGYGNDMLSMRTTNAKKGLMLGMMGLRFLGQKGFSLVEIAIVLVVVGVLISGGLLGLAPVLAGNKVTQTNAQLDRIEQALILYVIQNGCLPCPAVIGATITGQADDGAVYTTGCDSGTPPNTCTSTQGAVPWVNLGLSKDDVIDGYGNLIEYVPSPGLNQTSTSMVRTPPSTYPSGAIKVQTIAEFGADPACATATNCQTSQAAYVLISHGSDGSGGHIPNSTLTRADPNGSASQTANTAIAGASTTAYVQDKAQGQSGTTYFDDIVRFKTAPVIIQSCGSNACGNPA
jgi:prepilin-type N-terminal cleavage/methylation domain-containing protein